MWISTNLAGALGGIVAKANDAIDEVQSGLNKLSNQINLLTNKSNSAINTVASSKALLNKLAESGFYMITLSPKAGSWSSRLSAAPNSPPNLSYCCGTAVIITAADLTAASSSYQSVVDAAKKPMADASNIVDKFDFDDFTPDDIPSGLAALDESAFAAKDWSDIFPADSWNPAALQDVFGGYTEGYAKATNKLSKDARSTVAGINQTSRAASAINKGLTATQNLMTRMLETGVYTIALEPGAGNYLTRLLNEADAPDTSAALFTSGYVCIAVADTLEGLATKYETLSHIISGS